MTATPSGGAGWRVSFEPMAVAVDCGRDETLLDCARRHRIRLATSCGGQGTCTSCLVQVVEGPQPEVPAGEAKVVSAERLAHGWRRACLARPVGDCTVFVPPRSTAAALRTDVGGEAAELTLDPAMKIIPFQLNPPSFDDVEADDERLRRVLDAATPGASRSFDPALMRELANSLRKWGWRGWAASLNGEVIAAGPEDQRPLGLAIDLGTTNISGILVDLQTGSSLATKGCENPQTSFGADLIAYAAKIRRDPETAGRLRESALSGLNGLAADLCGECGTDPEAIVEAVVAGNTMMHHLLLGLPVNQLAMSPFIPAVSGSLDVKSRDVGLEFAPGANVHLLPNVAGFVGGDHTATLLTAMTRSDKPVIIMDIGTNTEISLVQGERITSVSCPSGPAFEGGHLSAGMRAAKGAIELVRIKDGNVRYETIGDGPPVGICGSGVLDAVAQLHAAAICNGRGQIQAGHARVREVAGSMEFVLAEGGQTGSDDIAITQDDVRAVQLAKGAIRAATDQLLEKTGFGEKDLDRIIIAGAFGNYIDVGSAIAIGMLPNLPYSRFVQVGNAAGEGARQVLVSAGKRGEARALADRAEYFELAGSKTFMTTFGARINFPARRNQKSPDQV